jgi:hypothetical protein
MWQYIKPMLWGLVGLGLLATAWRYRDHEAVRAWWPTPAQAAKPIKFDNDTPRSVDPALAPASSDRSHWWADGIRKCVQGKQVSYTDRACPPGSQELGPSKQGLVNVLAGDRPAGPVVIPATGRDPIEAPGTKHLREQAVERAINR